MLKYLSMAALVCLTLTERAHAEAFPSTYNAPTAAPILLTNATVLDGTGKRLDNTDIYLANGEISWVGTGDSHPDASVIDATGLWITPGLIDVHSHLGVYPSPGVAAHSDGNEATAPVTAEVWAEHSIWPQDPGLLVHWQEASRQCKSSRVQPTCSGGVVSRSKMYRH